MKLDDRISLPYSESVKQFQDKIGMGKQFSFPKEEKEYFSSPQDLSPYGMNPLQEIQVFAGSNRIPILSVGEGKYYVAHFFYPF